MTNDLRIAVIGSGVMGEALISGLLRRGGLRPQQIIAADPRQERCAELQERYGIDVTSSNIDAVHGCNILLIAVKPQHLPALKALHGELSDNVLALSIVAGVTLDTLSDTLGNQSIVRSMPNTPGQIGAGITVWACTPAVTEEQKEWAKLVLGALGREVYVTDEHYLDMATALNGTGPAYTFLFMESMVDAGVHLGLPRATAEELVLHTMLGSVQFALQSHRHPAQLRNDVTSSGGTTAAAVYELEKGGLRTVMSDAIWAAYRRSRELGKS